MNTLTLFNELRQKNIDRSYYKEKLALISNFLRK